MNPPTGTWHSPFAHCDLGADDLVRELALNAVSKILMIGLISNETAKIIQTTDSITVSAPAIRYAGVIPMPTELSAYISSSWLQWFNMFMSDYGLCGPADLVLPRLEPSGEKLGRLFRHFRVIDQLCHFTKCRQHWPEDSILGIHGADSPDLFNKLREAGITYLLVWREEHMQAALAAGLELTQEMLVDCQGSGCLKRLSLDQAETLALYSYAKESESTRRIFNLSHPFLVDSWGSNHPRFT